LGQGVGLVLSKIGLDHYVEDVPVALLPSVEGYLPFASNMIRCVAGFACFTAWLILSGHADRMRQSLSDHKGLLAMLCAVISGPFVGVGFSLMAVQYTAAGIASTLMALTPILILLPSRWLFGQPITLKGVVGALISVVGVSLFFLL
jgi:drug/metabolite transporter (DMT)-like permease